MAWIRGHNLQSMEPFNPVHRCGASAAFGGHSTAERSDGLENEDKQVVAAKS